MTAGSLKFVCSLKDWRARAGFVLGAAASRIPPLLALVRPFNAMVHGRYGGELGAFDLRRGTHNAFTVHPRFEPETHAAVRSTIRDRGGVMVDIGCDKAWMSCTGGGGNDRFASRRWAEWVLCAFGVEPSQLEVVR